MKQRKNYHMPFKSELLSLFWSTLAARFGILRHPLLIWAAKKGLPAVVSSLEAKQNANKNNRQG